MSIAEQINDALDDENPADVLTEITSSLIDENKYKRDLSDALSCINRNAKQVSIATNAISACFEKIKGIENKEIEIDYLDAIIQFLLLNPQLLKEFSQVQDLYLKICDETQQYSRIAKFYKEQGIDSNESEPAKFEYYLKIGELYLRGKSIHQANSMLNNAYNHRFTQTSPKPLLDRYDKLKAEIQVENQAFDAAADLFYQMSQTLNDKNERVTALKRAIIFAIVSLPGPKRDAIFHKISIDENAQILPIFQHFDRLNRRQIITGQEIETLWKEISTEKSIKKEDFENNMRLHNMTQIAYLYSVISFDRLAQIAGISPEEAETIVEEMIQNGRLKAKIDQPNKMIVYTRDDSHAKEIAIKEFSEAVDNVTLEIAHLN